MKRFACMGAMAAALAAGLAGCNWDTGGDADNWNSSYEWVNFSGVYRGSVTTTLDPDYKPSTPGATNSASEAFIQLKDRANAGGQVSKRNLVIASVTISTSEGAFFADNDGDQVLTGNGGSGTINYATGEWSIVVPDAFIPTDGNATVTVSYAYAIAGTEESGTEFGTTEVEDYSFTVHQDAQYLTVTDNTGMSYQGEINKIISASGAQNTDVGQVGAGEEANDAGRQAKYTYYESPLPENGDAIMANFEVSGSGGRIVGTFQGSVREGVFTDRRMDGTKISAGSSDDIKATAASVEIATAPVATETETETPTVPTGATTGTAATMANQ